MSRSRASGFTLLELAITLAVLAILVAMAAPSIAGVIRANRVTAAANELLATFQGGRMQAMSRNARVVLCRSVNGATCAGAPGNWDRWVSFIDANNNDVTDAGEALLSTGSAPNGVVISASPAIEGANGMLIIRPDGMARMPDRTLLVAAFSTCMPFTNPVENMRIVRITAGSQAVVSRQDGGGACPAPADRGQ